MNPNVLAFTDALTLFERMENESIDLIYLDPHRHYEDELEYNEFIYKILQQSKRVLKETGNLAFFTGTLNKVNLQPLITKVFGVENLVSEFIIPKKRSPINRDNFTPKHETLIFLRKSKQSIFNDKTTKTEEEIIEQYPHMLRKKDAIV